MELARIACKFAEITVAATTANGSPATLPGVDVCIVPPGGSPGADTVWTPTDFDPTTNVATVLVAGPDAANVPDAAVKVAGSSDLWARVVDNPETDAALIDHIWLA